MLIPITGYVPFIGCKAEVAISFLFLEATCSSSIFTLALQGQVLLVLSISDFCLRMGKVVS